MYTLPSGFTAATWTCRFVDHGFSETEITFCKPPYYVDQNWVRRITPCISTPVLLFGRAKYQLRMEVVIAVWQCWPNLGVSWAGVWIFRKTRVLAMCEENRLAETQSGGGSNGVNQWYKFSQRPWGETKAKRLWVTSSDKLEAQWFGLVAAKGLRSLAALLPHSQNGRN